MKVKLFVFVTLVFSSVFANANATVTYEGAYKEEPCSFYFELSREGKVMSFKGKGFGSEWVISIMGACPGLRCKNKGVITTASIGGVDFGLAENFEEYNFVQTGLLGEQNLLLAGVDESPDSDSSVSLKLKNNKIVFTEKISLGIIPFGKKILICKDVQKL